ncbi:MAG: cytosine permease [Gordonia sp. (in: high G+C Gram-positive bacteria)]
MTHAELIDSPAAGVRVVDYGSSPMWAAGDDGRPPVGAPSDDSRRGSWWYFWTWLVTPHIEFGAVYVGMIVVLFLDMSLVQAVLGIFLGTAFGAISHGILTARGVQLKVPQIVLGRLAFGARGNLILTTIMAVISSVGWFIVNSVVAALALNSLFGVPTVGALAIVVVIQLLLSEVRVKFVVVQRYVYPVLTVILVVAGVISFTKVDPSAVPGSPWNLNGLIAVVVVACLAWAYTIGWNPYATDYSREAPNTTPKMAGLCAAAGLFCATMFLMCVGAVAGIVVDQTGQAGETNPTTQFTSFLPDWLGVLVLLALIVGSWTANSITLKSAHNRFGDNPLGLGSVCARLLAPILISLAAFFLGWASLTDIPANFEGFVMVIGVWVAPWLNVSLIDYLLRRKDSDPTPLLYQPTVTNKWGLISVAFAIVASVLIYGIQIVDGGRLPHGGVSYASLAMLAGFYLSAVIYSTGMKHVFKRKEAASTA